MVATEWRQFPEFVHLLMTERKLQVGGNVLTLLFVVQLVIMIWKPGI